MVFLEVVASVCNTMARIKFSTENIMFARSYKDCGTPQFLPSLKAGVSLRVEL
jgi:hypothetical protein